MVVVLPLLEQFSCTNRCRSSQHSSAILSALTKASAVEAKAFCMTHCRNFWRISDCFGRQLLHWAASTGHVDLLEFLLANFKVDISHKDTESGYTALHRALLYGQIACAQLLSEQRGCSLTSVDREGLTAIGIVARDRLPSGYVDTCSPVEVYTFGENMTNNLGHRSPTPRTIPESVDYFRRNEINVTAVSMSKFHTLWLAGDGRVFACGHGLGGRLGFGDETSIVVPKQIELPEPCISLAAATDHSVFVTQTGIALTCGMNSHRQLGQAVVVDNKSKNVSPNSVVDKSLAPKPMLLAKASRGKPFIGCCAGAFHTVLWTKHELYTCGLNAGHLGHAKEDSTCYVPYPKLVSQAITHPEFAIDSVVTSDGAIGLLSAKGDIFIFTKFEVKRIALRQLDVKSLHMFGGHLQNLEPTVVPHAKDLTSDLRLCLLTKSGKVFFWQESDPEIRRCVFSGAGHMLYPVDIAQTQSGLFLVTPIGNLFRGRFDKPAEIIQKERKHETVVPVGGLGAQSSGSFAFTETGTFLDRRECQKIAVTYIPAVHRGLRVVSSSDGRNVCVFQQHPSTDLFELPIVSPSEFDANLRQFFEQSSESDMLHDVVVICVPGEKWTKAIRTRFPCHKYILMSRCTYFEKHLNALAAFVEPNLLNVYAEPAEIILEGYHPEIVRQVLFYIYCDRCALLEVGTCFFLAGTESQIKERLNESIDAIIGTKPEGKTSKKKKAASEAVLSGWDSLNPLKLCADAAKKLGLKTLVTKLNSLDWDPKTGRISLKPHFSLPSAALMFCRQDLPELYDLVIESADGRELSCHRCVLASRLEYFNCMLASGWLESGRNKRRLPIQSSFEILSDLLYYLYADKLPSDVNKTDSPDRICQLLLHSDQFLANRLRELCEVALANMISLRNAAELLEFASTYNAQQLKATCLQFISLNLSALFEAGALKVLSRERLVDVGNYYREHNAAVTRRRILPYVGFPRKQHLQDVLNTFDSSVFDQLSEQELAELYIPAQTGFGSGSTPSISGGAATVCQTAIALGTSPSTTGRRQRHGSNRKSVSSISEAENFDATSFSNAATNENGNVSLKTRTATSAASEATSWKQQDIIAKMRAVALNLKEISEDCQLEMLASQSQKDTTCISLTNLMHEQEKEIQKKHQQKLSKKQEPSDENYFVTRRKSLMSEGVTISQTTPPRPKPWTALLQSNGGISLRDVMDQEVKHAEQQKCQQQRETKQSSPPKPIAPSQPSTQSPWKIIPQSSDKSFETELLGTSPKFGRNTGSVEPETGFKTGFSQSNPVQSSFRAIIQEEREKQSGRQKQERKSFAIILFEEEAIQQLLQHYGAAENFDEHITVERVDKHVVAEPVWKALS